MKFTFLPKTKIGIWSVVIGVAFILLIWMKIQFSLPVPTFAIAALGLAGFILSLIAIFRNQDRAILNFLPVLVGLVIVLWFAAELIFPH